MELFDFNEMQTLFTNVYRELSENKEEIAEEYEEMDEFLEVLKRVKNKVNDMGSIEELKSEVGPFGWDLLTVLTTLQEMSNDEVEFVFDEEDEDEDEDEEEDEENEE
ncbi:MAG: hypothetical protein H7A37_06640 [Chlamydiales bacterium]|nr:hypothetical protein [Chlamydiales bacterium]